MTVSCYCLLCALVVTVAEPGVMEANPTNFPYVVAILSRNEIVCNGAILSKHWIVTTAHCLINIVYNETEVRVGLPNGGQQVRLYRRHTIFPEYYNNRLQDLGLLRIQGFFEFNNDVLPGQLAAEPFPRSVVCHSLGWTKTASGVFTLLRYRPQPIRHGGCSKHEWYKRQYLICTENIRMTDASRLLVCRGIIAGITVGRFSDANEKILFEVNLLIGYFHWYIQSYVYDVINPTPLYDGSCGFRASNALTVLALALTTTL